MAGFGGVLSFAGRSREFQARHDPGQWLHRAGRGHLRQLDARSARWPHLLFAASQAFTIQAQATGLGINTDLLLALPYLLTLVAIAGFVRRSRAPEGLGKHATNR